jgi:hypothetical protein
VGGAVGTTVVTAVPIAVVIGERAAPSVGAFLPCTTGDEGALLIGDAVVPVDGGVALAADDELDPTEDGWLPEGDGTVLLPVVACGPSGAVPAETAGSSEVGRPESGETPGWVVALVCPDGVAALVGGIAVLVDDGVVPVDGGKVPDDGGTVLLDGAVEPTEDGAVLVPLVACGPSGAVPAETAGSSEVVRPESVETPGCAGETVTPVGRVLAAVAGLPGLPGEVGVLGTERPGRRFGTSGPAPVAVPGVAPGLAVEDEAAEPAVPPLCAKVDPIQTLLQMAAMMCKGFVFMAVVSRRCRT